MKAIGYRTGYLLRVVLEQAAFNALAGWIPALLVSILLYRIIGHAALLPLHMTAKIIFVSLGLTLGMCLISAAIAVGRGLTDIQPIYERKTRNKLTITFATANQVKDKIAEGERTTFGPILPPKEP